MSPWDEPLDDTTEADDDAPRYRPDPDAVTVGVNGVWYVARHIEQACRETFPNSVILGDPMRFDRLYPATGERGPVLVDILVGDGDQAKVQAARKHVAFKREWCERHDRLYLALTEEDAQNPARVSALLAGESAQTAPVSTPAKRTPRARGQMQRPKANV